MTAKVKNFYEKFSSKVNFFEVLDDKGVAVWGGENQNEAIAFFTKDILNRDLIVTAWYSEGEDAYPAGSAINITPLVLAAIAHGRNRGVNAGQ